MALVDRRAPAPVELIAVEPAGVPTDAV